MVSAEWKEGYRAFENGLSAYANPHPAGTVEHVDWRNGWQAGEQEHMGLPDEDD